MNEHETKPLSQFSPAEFENLLWRYANNANKAERAFTEADEVFNVLKDGKDTLFATIVDSMGAKTTAEGERMALVSPQWAEFMLGYQKARKNAAQAKVERNTAIRLWDTIRSIMSSKNVERKTGI